MVAEGFEGLEAEFEGEDGGSGLGVEPGGEEEGGGFGDGHPGVFAVEVGFVGLHDGVPVN
jgi:hypothetical protein